MDNKLERREARIRGSGYVDVFHIWAFVTNIQGPGNKSRGIEHHLSSGSPEEQIIG